MTDELEAILARVASGELSPEAAEPLVAAAAGASSAPSARPADPGGPTPATRAVRIRVTDGGRQVVNLRIPLSLASLAGSVIPGLGEQHAARVRQALRDGETGTIIDVRDPDGSGVVIATE